ncbi:MAG TPA: hypothetical protein VGN00_06165 [Puia sp.]
MGRPEVVGVNGLLHLDQALLGLINDLRKIEKFMGRALETLLITPPAGTIPAGKLLLIGYSGIPMAVI